MELVVGGSVINSCTGLTRPVRARKAIRWIDDTAAASLPQAAKWLVQMWCQSFFVVNDPILVNAAAAQTIPRWTVVFLVLLDNL